MTDKAIELVTKVAAQLGVASEHVWATLVRQARVDAISKGVPLLMFMCLVAYGWRKFIKLVDELDSDGEMGAVVGLSIATAMALVLSITLGSDIITGLFNPDYWAMKELMRLVK